MEFGSQKGTGLGEDKEGDGVKHKVMEGDWNSSGSKQ